MYKAVKTYFIEILYEIYSRLFSPFLPTYQGVHWYCIFGSID